MKRSHRTSSVEYTSTRSPNKILCRGCLGRRLGISCTCGEAKSSIVPHQSPSCCHQDHLCLGKICNKTLDSRLEIYKKSKQAYSNEEAAYWKAGIQPHICSCGGSKSSRCSQNICLRRSQHKSYNSIANKISTWTQFLFSAFLFWQPTNNGCRAAPEPSWLPIPKWKLSTNRWK